MNTIDKKKWLDKLDDITTLAEGTKLRRWWHNPIKYTLGQIWAKGIYPLNKQVWLTSAGLFFEVPFHVTLPAGLDIFLLGAKSHDSEIRLAKFLIRHLKDGTTFFDVGAHLGYFSLLAGQLTGPSGKVISWEASPTIFAQLKKNVEAFPFINIHNQGMAAEKGDMIFFEFPMLYSEYNSLNSTQYQKASWYAKAKPKEINIKTTSLDEFVKGSTLPPDMIKIDVEGAEAEVIKGGFRIFSDHKPVIIMEFIDKNTLNDVPSAHQEAARLLHEAGYGVYQISKQGFVKELQWSDPLSTGFDSDNLVFIHHQNPLVP